MNTIKIFISCNENIQIRENTDVFISLDDNIYGIHSKRINILYLFYSILFYTAMFYKRYMVSGMHGVHRR